MSAALVKLADDLASCVETQKVDHVEASVWANVESLAQQLANGLRSHGEVEDHHGIVGATSLPQTLTTLLNNTRGPSDVQKSARIPQKIAIKAAYELLRVGANVCMDHDVNRGRLLSAEYPQTVLSILESYSDLLLETQASAAPDADSASFLTLEDFKIIKTAFGVLLNASLEYKPVRSVLIEKKAPGTILRLTSIIYPAGLWLKAVSPPDDDTLVDLWNWRSGLSAWSWRAIEELRPSELDVAWDEEALPLLIKSLDTFSPQTALAPTSDSDPAELFPPIPKFAESKPDLRYSLINADAKVMQEICMLVEALSADEERVRALLLISSGKSTSTTSLDSPFAHLIRFVEHAAPLPYWSAGPAEQRERPAWEKDLGLCKAAAIKAIVTVAGEDSQMDVLWGQNDPSGGWFVEKMLSWIKEYPAAKESRSQDERDDLVICATLCLANLARREARCVALVEPPISIVPHLIPLLDASTDIKLKHGVLGLFKHLAQTQSIRELLGQAGTIEAICKSKVWGRESDMADMVQLSAVGIVKHLGTSHIVNALRLFTPLEGEASGLDQILEVIRRTDSLALRNESTRVIVNLIKTLWTPSSSPTSPVSPPASELPPKVIEARRKAFDQLCSEEAADALAEMVGRNLRYPVLLNEGIMALTLLASQPLGVPHVVTALTSPLGPDMPASATRSPPISEASTSTSMANDGATPSTALDMIASQILSAKGKTLPPELRANACSLLTSVGRHDVVLDASDVEKLDLVVTIREAARSSLVALANEPVAASDPVSSPPMSPVGSGPSLASNRNPNLVRNAAVRTLAAWGTPVSSPAS